MEKMKMGSADFVEDNIRKIAEIFPNCITERKDTEGNLRRSVNFELLRQMLSGDELGGDEAYEFTWVGKKAAVIEANTPIQKTLRPCPEISVDWDNTHNLYIEGDNLEVLKLLQESYLGKVKAIYIDPPYNTGSDFIYRDNFNKNTRDYAAESGKVDEKGNRLFKNADTNGRFHSDWCSMIYPRLMLARNLLSEDGVIFISIDDHELYNLKEICDEVFGEANFVTNLIWQSTAGSNTGTDIVTVTESILVYTKKRAKCQFDGMIADEKGYTLSDEYEAQRGRYSLDKLDRRRVGSHYSEALNYPITMPDGSLRYPGGGTVPSTEGWNYLWSRTKVEWGLREGFIEFKQNNGEWSVYNKRYSKIDNEGRPIERTIPFRNLITSDQCNTAQGTAELRALFGFRPFDFPKPSSLIRSLLMTIVRRDREAVIMDFFSGSAPTAQAVMDLNKSDGGNRKFILVQIPEKIDEKSEAYMAGFSNICEIGRERILRAGKKIHEDSGDIHSVDTGFRVFKIDDSNRKDVYYPADDYTQDLLSALESNIKEDRTDLDLLFGCLLEWGLPLSMPYTSEKIDGCTVHTYNGGDLIACFDERLPESVIQEIAKRGPKRAVFRDSSFDGSAAKINAGEILRMLAPDTSVKVI